MRKLLSVGVVVAAVLAVVTPVVTNIGAQAANATTVVLSFDEGWANQSVVPGLLDAHGMKGTFYVNSANVDQPGWLTWNQLTAMQADGQEIGGASLTQADLAAAETATPGSAQTSICQDRARLVNHGLTNITELRLPLRSRLRDRGREDRSRDVRLQLRAPAVGPLGAGLRAAERLRRRRGAAHRSLRDRDRDPADVDHDCAGDGSRRHERERQRWRSRPLRVSPDLLRDRLRRALGIAGEAQHVPYVAAVEGGRRCHRANDGAGDRRHGAGDPGPRRHDRTDLDRSRATRALCSASYAEGNSISISLAADDGAGSGVDSIFYTTDGTTPTITSPVYTAPFPITYNTTIKYFAWDNAGNKEPVNTTAITIPDTIRPLSSILCNGTDCDNGFFNPSSPITLAGVDNGSGIKEIRYTTDGSAPTTTHGTVYAGPFTVPTTTTVKFLAIDKANLVEQFANSQTIQVDTGAPVASATCNGAACSTAWYTRT